MGEYILKLLGSNISDPYDQIHTIDCINGNINMLEEFIDVPTFRFFNRKDGRFCHCI